jgi:DNA invertase Pin-like site-specific DNA recombinase
VEGEVHSGRRPRAAAAASASTVCGVARGVLGSLAEYERELVRERTALKRASSRANGTKFGRPRKVDDTEHIATAKRMKADGRMANRVLSPRGHRLAVWRPSDCHSA